DEIDWVKTELESHSPAWPAPARIGVETYGCLTGSTQETQWFSAFSNPAEAFHQFFVQASAHAASMNSSLLLEEIGASHDCADCRDDGVEGAVLYDAALSAAALLDPHVPVGIWEYNDSNGCGGGAPGYGRLGLLKNDGSPTKGASVIQHYFAK